MSRPVRRPSTRRRDVRVLRVPGCGTPQPDCSSQTQDRVRPTFPGMSRRGRPLPHEQHRASRNYRVTTRITRTATTMMTTPMGTCMSIRSGCFLTGQCPSNAQASRPGKVGSGRRAATAAASTEAESELPRPSPTATFVARVTARTPIRRGGDHATDARLSSRRTGRDTAVFRCVPPRVAEVRSESLDVGLVLSLSWVPARWATRRRTRVRPHLTMPPRPRGRHRRVRGAQLLARYD
jgi:hypothetical protein